MSRRSPFLAPTPNANEKRSPLAVIITLGLGLLLFFALPLGPAGQFSRTAVSRWATASIAAALALLPPVHRIIARALERVRNPSDRARWKTAVVIAIGAAAY